MPVAHREPDPAPADQIAGWLRRTDGSHEAQQGRLGRRGRRPDPRPRHGRHGRVRRHRLRRRAGDQAGGTLPGDRNPARSDLDLRRGPGGRQGARAEPPGARRAGPARDRRPLGSGAQTAEAGPGKQDHGLQSAPGRDHPHVPGRGRGQAAHHHACGPGHLRGPAPRRRQDQRDHDRGSRRADLIRRPGVPGVPALADRHRPAARHDCGHGRQRHHGTRGVNAGSAGAGHGRQEFRRPHPRAGGARG